MNKPLTLPLLLFAITGYEGKAQYADENPAAKNWYSQPDGINYLIKHYHPICNFRPHETIASIGAGQGIREVVYSFLLTA